MLVEVITDILRRFCVSFRVINVVFMRSLTLVFYQPKIVSLLLVSKDETSISSPHFEVVFIQAAPNVRIP